MTDVNPPSPTQLGPGYAQIQFHNLKQFIDYLYSDMLDFQTYVWRGHQCDTWALEPTLDRLIRGSGTSPAEASDFAARHLEAFKYAARGRRGPNPPLITDENDWWALGQHHGLATPLLDWSSSPFVAAFFAFANGEKSLSTNRAIFALHQPSVESIAAILQAGKNEQRQIELESLSAYESVWLGAEAEPEIVFVRPLSNENNRLVSQQGLFTRSRTVPIESWVREYHPILKGIGGNAEDSYTLLKFLVPDYERTKCLQLLNRMNINPLSLFPDLLGASQYCNLISQIDNF